MQSGPIHAPICIEPSGGCIRCDEQSRFTYARTLCTCAKCHQHARKVWSKEKLHGVCEIGTRILHPFPLIAALSLSVEQAYVLIMTNRRIILVRGYTRSIMPIVGFVFVTLPKILFWLGALHELKAAARGQQMKKAILAVRDLWVQEAIGLDELVDIVPAADALRLQFRRGKTLVIHWSRKTDLCTNADAMSVLEQYRSYLQARIKEQPVEQDAPSCISRHTSQEGPPPLPSA